MSAATSAAVQLTADTDDRGTFMHMAPETAHPFEADVDPDDVAKRILERFDGQERKDVRRLLKLAARAHEGQTRGEGTPYVVHPYRVAYAVIQRHPEGEHRHSVASLARIAAAHDILEDVPEYANELRRALTSLEYKTVKALTKTKGVDAQTYLVHIVTNSGATAVKVEDRIDNIRFLHLKKSSARSKTRYLLGTALDYLPLAARLGPAGADTVDELTALLWDQAGRIR